MNHWFLVGRDLMWVFLGILPLILFGAGAREISDPKSEGLGLIFAGLLVQLLLLTLVYSGEIK